MSELKQKSSSRSQSRANKNAKNKKRTSKSTKRQKTSKDNGVEDSISSLINQFDSLFIDKDSAFDKKKIKEFARNTLIMKDADNDDSDASINYRNFIIVLLKMCGLGIDLEDEEEKDKFVNLVPSSSVYTAEKELDSLISNLKIRRDKIKNKLLSNNLNEIMAQVYNIFDFTNNNDFKKFKEFMRAIFKLTQNHTRKIRIIGTMIMCKITELILAEYSKNKKLLKQEEKNKKSRKKSANIKMEDTNYRMRYNLCNNLTEYINDIKKNFIVHKICDYSKEIRMLLCDMMERLSKNYFNIIFGEFNLAEYFNFFLQDPSNIIRVKYLQIIYDKLNTINETEDNPETSKQNKKTEDIADNEREQGDKQKEDKDLSKTTHISTYRPTDDDLKESMSIIIDILNKTKATILSICVKEDSFLAKSGIKILELLSKQNILETKTVNNLLLHLFNEEPKIRNLISQIAVNYILNFEQPNKEGIIPKPSIDHVHFLNQLALRLTGKVPNMMKVFVEDFFNELKIIKNYKLLFDYVNHLLNQDEVEFDLLQNVFILIDNSIKTVRSKIDELDNKDYIKKHDEFCEELINRFTEFLKKLRFLKNDKETRHNSNFDLVNNLLQLLQNFKLYPTSSFNIPFETVKQILFELKKTFFISTSGFDGGNKSKKDNNSELDIDSDEENIRNSNQKKIKQSQSKITEEKIIENYIKSNYSSATEKLCENILRGMSSILNDQKLFELFNYNDTQIMDQMIYSSNDKDNKECLAYIFFKTFQEQIISHPYYSEIAQNSGSNDISEVSRYISDNYDENIIYILINQFNQLIIYFPKIFTDVGGINLYEFEHFLISILRCKIQKFNNEDIKILEFNYNYVISLLNIIDTLHLKLFNNNVEFKENINEYIEIRNRIITMLFYIMSINYTKEEDKSYNSFLYLIKGKCLGLFLDIYMVTTHDKLQVRELQYELIPNLMSIFYIFVRNNFIRFLWDEYKENEIELNNEEDNEDEEGDKEKKSKKDKTNKTSKKKNEIFWANYKLQIFILKIFAEKFSRLLLINFRTFLNEPLCLLYFETFFLLPQSSIVQQITDYTTEILMTKEINQYKKFLEERNKNNNGNNNSNNTEEGKIFLVLYYMNKIVLRIFNNDSQLFNDENNPKPFDITYEEKLDMCQRYLNTYIRILRKMKQKYSKENLPLIEKDKIPYENFILNGIAFALDKSDVINGYICLENVYFLDFIKMYIKNGLFVDEEMIHDIIITYIKLAKKWEITENMNLIHIRFMEKFKSYILNKGHMKIVENKSSKDKEEKDENEEKDDIEEEKEKEEEKNEEESGSNSTAKKKREKSEKKKKSGKRKKRTYNEVIKEENEESEHKKRSRKTKKE